MLDVLAWCKFVYLRIASWKSVILRCFLGGGGKREGAQSASNARREESPCWWLSLDNHLLHDGLLRLFMSWSAAAGNSGCCGDKTTTPVKKLKGDAPNTNIAISGLVSRADGKEGKVSSVNKILKKFCHQNHWNFIEYNNVNLTQYIYLSPVLPF